MRQLFLILLLAIGLPLAAQDSYKITVKIDGYDQPFLTLANNMLDKQYIVDTARVTPKGTYVFQSDTSALPRGVYLIVTAPDNNYFQMIIGDDPDQEFMVKTTLTDLNKPTAKSSRENELFYEYLAYLDGQGRKSMPDREVVRDTISTQAQKDAAMERLTAITAEVETYQQNLMKKNPGSFVSAIIRTNATNNPPDFPDLDGDEKRMAQLLWLRRHYFDKIDLKDERLLRTPFLFNRIEYYTDKLFVQHPDTVAKAVDVVLNQMNPDGEMFKYYVSHFVNKASRSNLVGMDAHYVHMIDTYYKSGRAYWVDEESLSKMVHDTEKLRPLLIGKQAPNMKMKRRDGTPVELYDLDSRYTILYFWQFACGSCKKSTPVMKEFYKKWKDQGVEIFSICTKQGEIDKCWDYIDETEIGDWLHATDRYQRFYKDYDVTSTPSIFVLDENKKIVSKRIGAKQLDDVLSALEAQRKRKEEKKLEEADGK